MRPTDLSEFSYGFALTYEWVGDPANACTAVPVFPSLVDEGDKGWDVKLSRPTVPLFLQFKLADYMSRSTCKEAADGFDLPCYRFHTRGLPSKQHQRLCDLEKAGEEVYYSAPAFHRAFELNDAFLKSAVRSRSIWLRPGEIGALPDGNEHRVSFRLGGPWLLRSKPRPLRALAFEEVTTHLVEKIGVRGARFTERGSWHELADKALAIAESDSGKADQLRALDRAPRGKQHPIELLAFYASTLLQCQLFAAQSKP